MLPIDTSGLVYDRTNADTYEAADLNRVCEMCETIAKAALGEIAAIAELREQYGTAPSEYTLPDFTVPTLQVKTDYAITGTYTLEQMRQYLQNIVEIVTHFPPAVYKPLPESMRFLTAEGANNIEEDLKQSAENLASRTDQTKIHIQNTAAAFVYSGEIFAGGIL